MSGHTPGPWFVAGQYVYCRQAARLVAKTGSYFEEDEANAHLIAAAPDMLAALKEIAKIGREDYGPAAAARMDEIARAAIAKADAKAEGRS